jgi:hypothetical protein
VGAGTSKASERATATEKGAPKLKFDRPDRSDLIVFGGYCLAAGVYIAIGVTYIDFLFSFWVAVGYLLIVAWLLPMVVRRVL